MLASRRQEITSKNSAQYAALFLSCGNRRAQPYPRMDKQTPLLAKLILLLYATTIEVELNSAYDAAATVLEM